MKDKTMKVKYFRTDTGCLEIFVKKGTRLLCNLIVFEDDRLWLEVSPDNKASVFVYPPSALERNKMKAEPQLVGGK